MKRQPKHTYARPAAATTRLERRDPEGFRLIRVFVEGYDDVAFWRNIFDDFESETLRFEISVPPRADLAKGKRVLLDMIDSCNEQTLLCMDSDFDYLFQNFNDQSRWVNCTPYLFHTYTYATENYLCYPPTLHKICVKATKNDTLIFDFERFMTAYSRIIYPLFLWYIYSARRKSEKAFSLSDFRSSVRLNYLDLQHDGEQTLLWLQRQVEKRVRSLEEHHADWTDAVYAFGEQLRAFEVTPDNVYLFMQGHTLLDNVVLVLLHTVCERLREMAIERITAGTKQGIALKNELSNYNNSLRNVREVLLDNEHYKECFLYQRLRQDIERYLEHLGVPLQKRSTL
ncbi:MAG: DUF4435 domain-containing protein [Alistipes sp.]|nr:DUF4435 domain-containing protein [Alistipes sp.]